MVGIRASVLDDRSEMENPIEPAQSRIVFPVFDSKKRSLYNFNFARLSPPSLAFPRLCAAGEDNKTGFGCFPSKSLQYVSSEKTGCPGDQISGGLPIHETIRCRLADGTHSHPFRYSVRSEGVPFH